MSIEETKQHIFNIGIKINIFCKHLFERSNKHDVSKLNDPEKSIFDEYTPKLKECTYGTDEYKSYLEAMKPALDHHYANNRHHPEHFENGIKDMNLIDVVEMICDWKAASERHADGNLTKSIELNQKRFSYSDELKQIFLNTARDLEW